MLERLTPLQRAFVEWHSMGCGAAEAYRRASSRLNLGWVAKVNAAGLACLANVKLAMGAIAKDKMNRRKRDREWCLDRVEDAADRARDAGKIRDELMAIEMIAKLNGEMVERSEMIVKSEGTEAAMKRFNDALAAAMANIGKVSAQPVVKSITTNTPPVEEPLPGPRKKKPRGVREDEKG